MAAPGYIAIDKHRTARRDDIIGILAREGRRNKSSIISKKGTYYSRTGPKKLAERLEGDKEIKRRA